LVGYPSAKKLSFANVRLHDVKSIVEGTQIGPEKPVEELTLTDITGTAAKGIVMQHVRDAVLKDIKVTGLQGPLLTIDDVTGTGLDGAAKYESPATRPARSDSGAAPEARPPRRRSRRRIDPIPRRFRLPPIAGTDGQAAGRRRTAGPQGDAGRPHDERRHEGNEGRAVARAASGDREDARVLRGWPSPAVAGKRARAGGEIGRSSRTGR
jgi:hypothetical protein